jgi:hypothetical protein
MSSCIGISFASMYNWAALQIVVPTGRSLADVHTCHIVADRPWPSCGEYQNKDVYMETSGA